MHPRGCFLSFGRHSDERWLRCDARIYLPFAVRSNNAAVILVSSKLMVDDDRFSSKIVDNATEEFAGRVPRLKTLSRKTIEFSMQSFDNNDFVAVEFPAALGGSAWIGCGLSARLHVVWILGEI